jgi:hypothetical protein
VYTDFEPRPPLFAALNLSDDSLLGGIWRSRDVAGMAYEVTRKPTRRSRFALFFNDLYGCRAYMGHFCDLPWASRKSPWAVSHVYPANL